MVGTESEQDMAHSRDELAKALPKLTAEQLANVSPHFIHETYAAGATIIRQGDPPDRFYILVNGQAEVWHDDLQGSSHLVAELGPGEYFGETGLLQNHPRTATIRTSAVSGADVLSLDRENFLSMMDESRATENLVAREMIRRLINLADYQG